jgi:hypothetical protein
MRTASLPRGHVQSIGTLLIAKELSWHVQRLKAQ